MPMLNQPEKPASVRIADANPEELFPRGLEYDPPTRGKWNIVHMGMMLPEAHQIYGCAQGCLRGVIQTAAEMNTLERLSWISLQEEDMFNGTLEISLVEGVTEILQKLEHQPPVVLLFLSCMHLFAGCDFDSILQDLSDRFPGTEFIDCYMTPTMRHTITPVALTARQLYRPLKRLPENPRSVNLIGNDRPTDEDSELMQILRGNGFTVRDMTRCQTYAEYLQMGESCLNLTYLPSSTAAGEDLEERLGIPHLYLPICFQTDEIIANYQKLCDFLHIPCPDFSEAAAKADRALDALHSLIGETETAVDYSAVTRPFSLAQLLCEHGINVRYIIADSVSEDTAAFAWLQENRPDITIFAPSNINMLHFVNTTAAAENQILGIGQKSAYYFATDHFVNTIANGGYYGFSGICKLAEEAAEAFRLPKNRRAILRHKGFGCASCLDFGTD